jgi:hypothetical protein
MLLNRNNLLVFICLYSNTYSLQVAPSTQANNILTCSKTMRCRLPPSSASWQPPRPPNQFAVALPSHLAFLTRASSSATVMPGWAHSKCHCVQHDDDDDGNHGGGGGGRGVAAMAAMAATTTTLPCAPRPLCAKRRRRRRTPRRQWRWHMCRQRSTTDAGRWVVAVGMTMTTTTLRFVYHQRPYGLLSNHQRSDGLLSSNHRVQYLIFQSLQLIHITNIKTACCHCFEIYIVC